MATRIRPITAGVAFASPDEGRGMSVPAFNRVTEPIFEDLHIVDVMTRQRPSLDNALDRLGHVEPGACVRRGKQQDPMFSTPLRHARALVPSEILPDQQYSDWREKPIQLLGCWVDVPILPASSFG